MKTDTYHHGNLRDTLLVRAAELIRSTGNADISLSEVAKKSGVSSAAPYRHFRNREEMFEALAELGFMRLHELARELVDESASGGETISRLGDLYMCFLVEHRPFLNLMWGPGSIKIALFEEDSLRGVTYRLFAGVIEDWLRANGKSECNPVEVVLGLWALAHGLFVLSHGDEVDLINIEEGVLGLYNRQAMALLSGLR